MDLQLALITKIVEVGDLRVPWAYNIMPEALTNYDAKLALEYITYHFRETNTVPSRKLLESRLPGVNLEDADDDIEAICCLVAEELTESEYRNLQVMASEVIREHPIEEAAQILGNRYIQLSTKYGKQHVQIIGSRSDGDFDEMVEEEGQRKTIPYVWAPLQLASGGMSPGELIVLHGRRKSAKTWDLLEQGDYSALRNWRILCVGSEMRTHLLKRRLYALRGRFPYGGVKDRSLFNKKNPQYETNQLRLADVIGSFKEKANFIIYDEPDDDGRMRWEMIQSMVEKHRPDLLLVDQLHYINLGDDRLEMRHRLGNVCRRLKALGEKFGIPVMATTQTNRTGMIAESDQIEQIADVVIEVSIDETGPEKTRRFVCKAARELELDGWVCGAKFCDFMDVIQPHLKSTHESGGEYTRPRRQKILRSRNHGS